MPLSRGAVFMNIIIDALSAIKNIRLQDGLDIAIIAAMIFALLRWFKTRASRFVLIGILLLGCVYLAARFLQLYLTVIVLQGFFAILLFVLVVIFQEDLRGVFERLARSAICVELPRLCRCWNGRRTLLPKRQVILLKNESAP